jgi:hypothetical protein
MKNLNMETVRKRYNGIMYDLGLDHLTVWEKGSKAEEGSEAKGWNLRDMVAEADYQLGLYYEEGTLAGDMRYSDYESERKAWRSESGKLERFIKAYLPFTEGMECTTGHCSQYD